MACRLACAAELSHRQMSWAMHRSGASTRCERCALCGQLHGFGAHRCLDAGHLCAGRGSVEGGRICYARVWRICHSAHRPQSSGASSSSNHRHPSHPCSPTPLRQAEAPPRLARVAGPPEYYGSHTCCPVQFPNSPIPPSRRSGSPSPVIRVSVAWQSTRHSISLHPASVLCANSALYAFLIFNIEHFWATSGHSHITPSPQAPRLE